MKEEQVPLRNLVQDQGKKLDEMYFAIMGNKDAQVDGLVQKVGKHGESIKTLEEDRNKQKGALWVLSFIGLAGLEELIRNIFTK